MSYQGSSISPWYWWALFTLVYNLLQGLISDAVLSPQRIFALIVPQRTKLAPELSQKNQVIIKGFFPFLSLTLKSRKNVVIVCCVFADPNCGQVCQLSQVLIWSIYWMICSSVSQWGTDSI